MKSKIFRKLPAGSVDYIMTFLGSILSNIYSHFSNILSGGMKLHPRYLLWLVSPLYALAIIMYLKHFEFQGDTNWLINQTRAALDCAAQGHWIGCRDGGRFPLLQRIPVIPMIGLGFGNSRVVHCLALLNVLLALTVALARRLLGAPLEARGLGFRGDSSFCRALKF